MNNELHDLVAPYQMSDEDVIKNVEQICRRHQVEHLDLFGSFAAGNPSQTSDIDFVVRGCQDFDSLNQEIQNIPTARKIDLFDYDHIVSAELKEDMDKYGKKIY